MSSNRYVDKIIEDGIQKQAFIEPLTAMATAKLIGMGMSAGAAKGTLLAGHAVGVHAAQNLITAGVVRGQHFGKNISEHFHAGMQGRIAPHAAPGTGTKWQRFKRFVAKDDIFNMPRVAGGINPELNIIRDEAYHLGRKFRSDLQSKGLDPDNLPTHANDLISHLAKGNFAHVKKTYMGDQHSNHIIDSLSKVSNNPLGDILRGGEASIAHAEKAWKDNSLSGNIVARIGDRPDLSHLPKGETPKSTIKSLQGTAVLASAMSDPALAILNTSKALLADSRIMNAIPGGTNAANKLNKFLVTDSVKGGLEKGEKGLQVSKPYAAFSGIFGSNIVTKAKGLANELGIAKSKAVVPPSTGPVGNNTKSLEDVIANSDLKNKYIAYLSSGGAGAVGGKAIPQKPSNKTPTDRAA